MADAQKKMTVSADDVAIQITNMNKWFGTFHVLRDINMTVMRGERIVICGPSGSGKSTLIRCVNRLEEHQQGQIIVDGTEQTSDLKNIDKVRSEVGMVFQHFNLFPHLTILENLTLAPIWVRKVPRKEAEETAMYFLHKVKIPEQALKYPGQLSGGQQQRVALARALVIRPRCLLLDEPLSNLDAKLRLEMRTEIRRVCKEFKLTTVYVTHDQKEALSIADRMAILESGHILQVGTPREVYKRPTRKTVANFIGETDFLPGKVLGVSGDYVTVETKVGRFDGILGDPTQAAAVGAQVTISIRPECWELHRNAEARNVVRGRIGESVYLGEVAQYDFVTTGGTKLKIFERNPRFADGSSRGELFATVEPEDVVVLTE